MCRSLLAKPRIWINVVCEVKILTLLVLMISVASIQQHKWYAKE